MVSACQISNDNWQLWCDVVEAGPVSEMPLSEVMGDVTGGIWLKS